jgi:hypothetical protein
MGSPETNEFDWEGHDKWAAQVREIIDQQKAAYARGDREAQIALHLKLREAMEADVWTEDLIAESKRLMEAHRKEHGK